MAADGGGVSGRPVSPSGAGVKGHPLRHVTASEKHIGGDGVKQRIGIGLKSRTLTDKRRCYTAANWSVRGSGGPVGGAVVDVVVDVVVVDEVVWIGSGVVVVVVMVIAGGGVPTVVELGFRFQDS